MVGGGLGQQATATTAVPGGIPAAPSMPAGAGYAAAPVGVGGPAPPPPPPLPPGTVIPQSRPLPPAMPPANVMPLGGLQLPPGAVPTAITLTAPAVVRRVLERPANG